MTYTPPAHTPYQWKNKPSTDTPLDEAHLEAAEQDLEDYTKTGLVDLATWITTGPTIDGGNSTT